jgi:deoxyadenosine/deoxycytidine kinase
MKMRISIGGSIGSGKSTVLERLKQDGYTVFFEPIDQWKHLSKFYQDKKRWSFTFQVEVLNSFSRCPEEGLVVCERSPWESYNIFSKMLVSSGDMNVDEFELYGKLYDAMAWKPDLFIYLRTSPETCMERIKKRDRQCESNIDMGYLTYLNSMYDEVYNREYVCVDANRDHEEVYQTVKNIITNF